MERLEIELYRYHTLVFGKVLHQDESLRNGNSGDMKVLHRNSEFAIVSEHSPMLYNTYLSVRGDQKDNDSAIFSQKFRNEAEAKRMCERISNGVRCINNRAEFEGSCKTGIIKVL